MVVTALVTGASTGIGAACVAQLDRMGWRVFAGVRREADAQAVVQRSSDRVTPVMLDVTNADHIAAASAPIDAVADGLQGLVNNAGIAVGGPLELLPIDALRHQLEVNVIGQVAVTQAMLPALRRGSGRIVNIGSISGLSAAPFIGPYAASKFALEAINDTLRQELKSWDIDVIMIEPGSIDTPIWEKSLAANERLFEPAQVEALYGPLLDRVRDAVSESARIAAPAEEVARLVGHVLVTNRPKTRYLIGKQTRMRALASRFLPDRVMDRLIERRLRGMGWDRD